jgi:hypothetical protein
VFLIIRTSTSYFPLPVSCCTPPLYFLVFLSNNLYFHLILSYSSLSIHPSLSFLVFLSILSPYAFLFRLN